MASCVAPGLYVGYSAAANVSAAANLLQSGQLAADAVVATVLCDTGLKYWLVPEDGTRSSAI
jgi:cysteine synthase A